MKSTFFHSPRFFSGLGIHALCLRLLLIGFAVAFNARAQVALVPQLAALTLWEPAWEATKDADSGSAKAVAETSRWRFTQNRFRSASRT